MFKYGRLVNDMYAENGNDDYKGYKELATQEDLIFCNSKHKVYLL